MKAYLKWDSFHIWFWPFCLFSIQQISITYIFYFMWSKKSFLILNRVLDQRLVRLRSNVCTYKMHTRSIQATFILNALTEILVCEKQSSAVRKCPISNLFSCIISKEVKMNDINVNTEGSCLMRLLGPGKSRISQKLH